MHEWNFKSRSDLSAAGWRFERSSECKTCHARIDWWRHASGRFLPLDPEGLQPHYKSCAGRGGNRARLSGLAAQQNFCAVARCSAKVPPRNHFCRAHWEALPWFFQGELLDLKNRHHELALCRKLATAYLEHTEKQEDKRA